jgi:hypothetical protein
MSFKVQPSPCSLELFFSHKTMFFSYNILEGVPFSNMDSDANTLQLRPQKEPRRILYWSNFLKLNNIYIFKKSLL